MYMYTYIYIYIYIHIYIYICKPEVGSMSDAPCCDAVDATHMYPDIEGAGSSNHVSFFVHTGTG